MTLRLQPNERIAARFRLEHPLGEGGMAVVWAAREDGKPDRVALKFLKVPDPMMRRRLVREARAASSIGHPGIVSVREIVEHDSAPVLVMELLEGESLADLLSREGSLGADAAAPIFFDTIQILAAAHAAGIVHRDVKPENIFLPASGGVKMLDFGVAKEVSVDAEAARSIGTQTGSLVGTPMFMSPEQVFGDKDIDHRADIWALGIVMYEALSGVVPTSADSLGLVFRRIIGGSLRPLMDSKPGLSAEVCAIVDRMLSLKREARPSLQEVVAVLARIVAKDAPQLPEPCIPAPISEPKPVRAPKPIGPVVAPETAPELVHDKPRWGLLLGALALAAVVCGVIVLLTRSEDEPKAPDAASVSTEASVIATTAAASAVAPPVVSASSTPSMSAPLSVRPSVSVRPPKIPTQDLDF